MRFRHPSQLVVAAFAVASLAGGLLLWLPAASHGPRSVPFLTALFTATSAVCVTGLNVVDTPETWTLLGELIILVLIQVGGFGIMTLSALLLLVLARRIGMRQRLVAAHETGSLDLGDVRRVLLGVARYSLAFEAVATAVLWVRFLVAYDEGAGTAAYHAVFHAVSAFNNAGFALWSDSLERFSGDVVVLGTVGAAVVAGGLGYPVWSELRRLPRRPRRWSLHVKLTLGTTAVLLVAGWFLIGWFEWTNDATLGPMRAGDKLVNALFHSVMPRTAGFSSLPVPELRDPTQLLTQILMFIGGGSASTAGGIKVTTFALLGFVLWAEVRGERDVVVFDRRVPEPAQRQALSVVLLAIGVVMAATMAITASTGLQRDDVLFEAVSAFGTVGLSLGITDDLTNGAQLMVAGLMLLGRVGPITLFAALVLKESERLYRYPEERPIVG